MCIENRFGNSTCTEYRKDQCHRVSQKHCHLQNNAVSTAVQRCNGIGEQRLEDTKCNDDKESLKG